MQKMRLSVVNLSQCVLPRLCCLGWVANAVLTKICCLLKRLLCRLRIGTFLQLYAVYKACIEYVWERLLVNHWFISKNLYFAQLSSDTIINNVNSISFIFNIRMPLYGHIKKPLFLYVKILLYMHVKNWRAPRAGERILSLFPHSFPLWMQPRETREREGCGPCWLLKLRQMGTHRVQTEGVLPWLFL
jgi:hypothetical protein